MNEYWQGEVVVSEVIFRDKATNDAVDPTTVTFYYQLEDGTPSAVLTYTGATSPAVGVIARVGVGRYVSWIDTTAFVGVTKEVWPSTGDYQTVGRRLFKVKPV